MVLVAPKSASLTESTTPQGGKHLVLLLLGAAPGRSPDEWALAAVHLATAKISPTRVPSAARRRCSNSRRSGGIGSTTWNHRHT